MEYAFLSKLFYENKDEYEEEYKARYESEYTVRLNFDVNGNPAFFVQTPAIYSTLADILRMNKAVYGLCNALPGAATEQFFRRCLIDEIVLTNNIEGVRSTRKEILEILDELEEKSKGKRFYGLVNKYCMLIAKEKLSISTCQDVRKIYDELVLQEVEDEDPGNAPDGKWFRKDSVSIYSPSQKEIHKGVYPEEKIIQAMDNALAFLHDDSCEVLFRIAIFHYLFEYIHPFYDGNGRIGRFICSYLLSQELEPITGYRLSYTIKENLSKYYKAFQECNDAKNCGDLTPFIIMFLAIVCESFEKLYTALEKRCDSLSHYRKLIYEIYETNSFADEEKMFCDILLQTTLFSDKGITKKKLCDELKISPSTVDKRLDKVRKTNLLAEKKGERAYQYALELSLLTE